MNWTMPYPWRSRSDSVRRINMSSEPGNESFFCALRPIPRILSLRCRGSGSQVAILNGMLRRDFLNNTLLGAGAALLQMAPPAAAADSYTGYAGVGDYARSNGDPWAVV